MSVFVVLGLIWAAVLVPPMLRARAERRAEFIDSFQEQMGALGKGHREAAVVNRPRALRRRVSTVKRRRDVLGGLVGAMLGALILGAFPSLRIVWALFLFLLNLFIAYVSLLVHQRDLALQRRMQGVGAAAPRARPVRPEFDPGTLATAFESTT